MEGLTITPDGKELVGLMQSALQQTDLNGSNAKNLVPTRIVTYNLRTHALHEYLYLLHDPKTNGTANSELTALSDTTFLVDERDGNFPVPNTSVYKKLWKIDITGATDVGPGAAVPGANYDGAHGGLLIGGSTTIEKLTLGENTAAATATLAANHITPANTTASPYIDLDALLLSLDPQARFFSHDKIEGVAALNGGHEIVISNDSDFGISGVDRQHVRRRTRRRGRSRPRSARPPASRTTGSTSRSTSIGSTRAPALPRPAPPPSRST